MKKRMQVSEVRIRQLNVSPTEFQVDLFDEHHTVKVTISSSANAEPGKLLASLKPGMQLDMVLGGQERKPTEASTTLTLSEASAAVREAFRYA